MKCLVSGLIGIALMLTSAYAADGVIQVPSAFSVAKTTDRLEQILSNKGMRVFARVNHAAGAKSVSIPLRDTELLIFGNPAVGSPLMKCQQSVALDLPQKALIWQDASEQVWISYNDPFYLKSRHQIEGCDKVLGKVQKALAAMTGAAATP